MTFRHKLAHRLALLRGHRMVAPVAVREPHPSVAQLVVSPNNCLLHTVTLWRPVS